MERILGRPVERILTIRLGAVGDVATTLPAVFAVRQLLPHATLHHLVDEKAAGLLRDFDWFDEVIVVEREAIYQEFRHWSWSTLGRLSQRLKNGHYDVVLDFQNLARSAVLSLMTEAPVRVGKAVWRELNPMAFNVLMPIVRNENVVLQHLELVRALTLDGERPVAARIAPVLSDASREAASQEMRRVGLRAGFVAVAPGSKWSGRVLPDGLVEEIIRALVKAGEQVVLVGGGAEAAQFERLRQRVPVATSTDLALPALCAFLDRAGVMIAADSAPMHLGDLLNRPLVAVFGPSAPELYGPFFAERQKVFRSWRGKHDFRGGNFDYFAGIDAGSVARAASEMCWRSG